MAHTVYACPNCDSDLQAVLTRRSVTSFRPQEKIICRDCLAEFPWQDAVIRKSATMLRGLGGVGSSASGPPPVFLGSGSFYDESGATTTVTVTNVTAGAGQTLIACVAAVVDGAAPNPAATWNGGSHDDSVVTVNFPGKGCGYNVFYPVATATADLVVTITGANAKSAVVLVYRILGTMNPAINGVGPWSNGFGTSTTPASSSDMTTTRSNSLFLAEVGTFGPQSDDAGVWTDNLIALDRIGTAGATAALNSTLSTAFKYPPVAQSQNVGKTGITSREWAILGSEVRFP